MHELIKNQPLALPAAVSGGQCAAVVLCRYVCMWDCLRLTMAERMLTVSMPIHDLNTGGI